MATISSAAISVPSFVQRLPCNNIRAHFCYPVSPNYEQKVANLRQLCSQGRIEEVPKLLLELEGSLFSLDSFTCNKILSSLVKHDRADDARRLFDKMSNKDDVSWSTMISGYTRSGNFLQTLSVFENMMEEGLMPNEFSLGSLLKVSSGLRNISLGRKLHGLSIRTGFGLEAGVRTSLITMYSNCGLLEDAQRVFDEVPTSFVDDIPLWNSIIAAYVSHGCWSDAFYLFDDMLTNRLVVPTERTYTSMISACLSSGEQMYGEIILGRIVKDGLFGETNLRNSLVTFFARCGNLEKAMLVFDKTSRKNVVSWNSIIAGNEQNDEDETAINLFHKMLRYENLAQPNRITLLSVISAVSGVSALEHGREIHAHMMRSGLDLDTSIGNSLITMYSKCGEVRKARMVFDRLPSKDVITWNSMLSGYEQNEQWENCLELFKKMQSSGVEPDAHSFTVILSAASSGPSRSKYSGGGGEIHGYILRRNASDGFDISTANAIITMYSKCNRVADAEKIFKGMRNRDSYSWNAMMDAYSINGRSEDAVMAFVKPHEQGFPSDYLAFSILLTACGKLASLQLGKQFHAIIVKYFHHPIYARQSSFLSINNAMVSMYSKCGNADDTAQLFSRMGRKDVFSWTAMITGYAHHGMAHESLQLFQRMKREGVNPNQVTFLGLLTACAYGGLIEEGTQYFSSMRKEYGLNPSIEHYACMVDMFSRSGQFDHAIKFIEDGDSLFKPSHGASLNLWRVLLGACHAHKQLELGIHAATIILESEPEDETTHILLSNLYASSGMWEEAIRVRNSMRSKGLKKEVGCSWIEAGNRTHIFVAGDVSHPWRNEIYGKLEELSDECRKIGYLPMTESVLHDVEESQKEAIIGCHSEKLAVSLGLIHSGSATKGVIRVIKNLRVCQDCHNWMKFISQVEGIEIVLRDSRRFHSFKDGRCSCRDYW